ncbi:MAG TPA: Hsp20/alpha crystallin family protein [Candidatus Acidoferrales bacterium]|nr:Hsp20/alpha crystallin family protein [Candidatus Acidoferrales bacterium]
MRRLTEDIDRAFGFGGLRRSGSSQQDFDWIPPVELRQEGNNLVARVDLPGMDENDIKVEVTEDGLEISGEREQETTSEEGGTRRSEISYGRFYRLIPLPEGADTENAKANFQKGVLEVTIPVSHPQQTRKSIPISTSAQSSQGATQGSQETRSRAATSST